MHASRPLKLPIATRLVRERAVEVARATPVQSPATGFAGAATMLTLYVAYTQFQARLMEGGPKWSSLFGFSDVARDYVDILLCLLVTFLVMVVFEKARSWARVGALVIAAVAASNVAGAGLELERLGAESVTSAEITLVVAAGALALLLAVDLAARPSTREAASVLRWSHALRAGFWRWLALWAVISLALVVYQGSKLYAGLPVGTNGYYTNWRITAQAVWTLFSLFGLAYCVLTVRHHHGIRHDRADAALALLLLARRAWRTGPRSALRRIEHRRFRAALADVAVKFFWAPLMVTFLFNECGALHAGLRGIVDFAQRAGPDALGRFSHAWAHSGPDEIAVSSGYDALYHGLFVADVSIGLLGYLSASRWLGNKSKSVDTSGFGWMVALACYPPFNDVTGQIVPYGASHGPAYAIFGSLFVQRALMLATLGLFVIYVWATLVFGLRFSNLTHRGLIESGPYRWIRHPAYATKNLAWWTESVRSFGNPWQFAYILGCNLLYALRAYTEEKHLLRFEDYRRYAARVRWRFLPGVF